MAKKIKKIITTGIVNMGELIQKITKASPVKPKKKREGKKKGEI